MGNITLGIDPVEAEFRSRLRMVLGRYCENQEVLENTPDRVLRMYKEMFGGANTNKAEMVMILKASFQAGNYDEMVVVTNIPLVSMCEHHLLPFIGKAHFGYLPDNSVVGLSKIPRLIKEISRKPQLQERLTHEVVSTFQEAVNPKGCGIVIEAEHTCMTVRGAGAIGALTTTTALEGGFRDNPSTKQEFLSRISSNGH